MIWIKEEQNQLKREDLVAAILAVLIVLISFVFIKFVFVNLNEQKALLTKCQIIEQQGNWLIGYCNGVKVRTSVYDLEILAK